MSKNLRLMAFSALVVVVAVLSSAATIVIYGSDDPVTDPSEEGKLQRVLLADLTEDYGQLLSDHKISTIAVTLLKKNGFASSSRNYERAYTNPLAPQKMTRYVGLFPGALPFRLEIDPKGKIFLHGNHSIELEQQIRIHLNAVTSTAKRMQARSSGLSYSGEIEW
jgi:hypothetical protein